MRFLKTVQQWKQSICIMIKVRCLSFLDRDQETKLWKHVSNMVLSLPCVSKGFRLLSQNETIGNFELLSLHFELITLRWNCGLVLFCLSANGWNHFTRISLHAFV